MTRVNERIRAPKIRVVFHDGTQLGIMNTSEAIQKAKMIGMDVVEIAGKVDPPVCKIVNYGKYKYEQSKLKKDKKKSTTKLKEVKFRVRTELHDYNIKCNRIETFLDEGHKVRVQLQFRGRENAHKELGVEKLKRVAGDMVTMAHVDQAPRIAGRAVTMILSPLPKDQRVRKFKLFHGDLIEEDDFEDIDDEENDIDGETTDEASDEQE